MATVMVMATVTDKVILMKTRRNFLKNAAIGAAGVAIIGCSEGLITEYGAVENDQAVSKQNFPVIVSTWNHGLDANAAAKSTLGQGGTILDAVEAGVRITESDPTNQSVGLGGLPDRDGNVTLDACIMNHESQCGAVSFLQHIENPISVARKVMEETPHIMLSGVGAFDFALEHGFRKTDLLTEKSRIAWEEWKMSNQYQPKINSENHDTIGLLGIDADGRIAGACTTSGMAYKLHGRVGDSPIIGAGTYANNKTCGVSCTGHGEYFIRKVVAYDVSALMEYKEMSLQDAANYIINEKMVDFGGSGGLIAMDAAGNIAMPFNTKGMYRGYKKSNGETVVKIFKE